MMNIFHPGLLHRSQDFSANGCSILIFPSTAFLSKSPPRSSSVGARPNRRRPTHPKNFIYCPVFPVRNGLNDRAVLFEACFRVQGNHQRRRTSGLLRKLEQDPAVSVINLFLHLDLDGHEELLIVPVDDINFLVLGRPEEKARPGPIDEPLFYHEGEVYLRIQGPGEGGIGKVKARICRISIMDIPSLKTALRRPTNEDGA
ncbi:MAG: hypothetical protein Q8O11_01570 [Syntrophales bacterium]|nr:hypothetical protein [Syntrophales bacterium]